MEEEIKQLIELDVMADKLKKDYDKKYEEQVNHNNKEIENLKTYKEQEIKKLLNQLENNYEEEISKEVNKEKQEREKAINQTNQILNQNKENITKFLMFNIKESFNTVK